MINAAQIHDQANSIFSQFATLKSKVSGITQTVSVDDLDERFTNIRAHLLSDAAGDDEDDEQTFSPRG